MAVWLNEKHPSIHFHSVILSLYLPCYYSAQYYANFTDKVLRFSQDPACEKS